MLGLFGPLKVFGVSVNRGVRSKNIIQSSITAWGSNDHFLWLTSPLHVRDTETSQDRMLVSR